MMARPPVRASFGAPPRAARTALAAAALPTPAAAPSTPSADDGIVATVASAAEKLAPIASEFLNTTAAEEAAVLRAKIRNNEELRDKFPEPLKTYYRNEVRKLKAKLSAKLETAKEEARVVRSKQEWANLGKGAAVVGILIGVALLGNLIKRSR